MYIHINTKLTVAFYLPNCLLTRSSSCLDIWVKGKVNRPIATEQSQKNPILSENKIQEEFYLSKWICEPVNLAKAKQDYLEHNLGH